MGAVERTRVLVADDNGVYRVQLGRFLASHPDMEVVGYASDGLDAVRLASLLQPDVVLMDLCMPECDGFDATRALKVAREDVNVIALTAHRTPDVEQRSIEAGAAAFLSKSDVDRKLIELIRGICANERDHDTRGSPRDS